MFQKHFMEIGVGLYEYESIQSLMVIDFDVFRWPLLWVLFVSYYLFFSLQNQYEAVPMELKS